MEKNQNANNDLAKLQGFFKDYKKKQKDGLSNKGKASREDILKKYFTPRDSKETFRFLPVKEGKDFIQTAFFHVVPTLTSGGKVKHNTIIYCPAHNDRKVQKMNNGEPVVDEKGKPVMIPAPCPLCAKYKTQLAKQDPSLKGVKKDEMNDMQLAIKKKNDEIFKEAIKWQAKKFYIVRGIDRGAEKDGVKFWRFKHNHKNQGTLDKLLPILEDYVTIKGKSFMDVREGADLSITMVDAEFNNKVYKQISAITYRDPSPLHSDAVIQKQWLEDDITWRDVFKPKKAPNITPFEYLELVAQGNSPYWDDTDSTNKRWVFPNNPELETKANTRSQNLDADSDQNSSFEHASDLDVNNNDGVTIANTTEEKVGTYNDDAVNLGDTAMNESNTSEMKQTTEEPVTEEEINDDQSEIADDEVEIPDDYDDLPF